MEPIGWRHDHCALCWATLIDPGDSQEARRRVDVDPNVFAEGYSIAEQAGARPTWICPRCVDEVAEEFEWQVSKG